MAQISIANLYLFCHMDINFQPIAASEQKSKIE